MKSIGAGHNFASAGETVSEKICDRCGRPRHVSTIIDGTRYYFCPEEASYVYATHEPYGCDTGCCGHAIIVADKEGNELERNFHFTHPSYDYQKHKTETDDEGHPQIYELNEAASRLHLPINWERCEIVDD